MAYGRSAKSVRNVATGLISKLIMIVLAFATRTLFIRLLGPEYTGVNSLYTNILSVLSLAELGMGNVLMFYLYGALKDNDEDRIVGLVYEFKKIYTTIIIVVLSVGILLIPFLRFIVRSSLNNSELIGYYLLYLINSVASYFVVYRTLVLSADQKNYISNIVHTVGTIAMYAFQILYLLLMKDFWGYLTIQVISTVGTNIVLNVISLKHYPYLKRQTGSIKHGKYIEKKELFRNIKATFLYKVADTVLDQTDSIIISIMFGTAIVGYYTNYFMIISYLVAIASIIANGLVASFGNLNTEGNKDHSYTMFRVALTAFSIFGIVCTTCYATVIQDFIPIWVGSQYVMRFDIVVAILSVFYLRMVTNTMWMYRSAMGLFKEVQYVNLVAAVINVVLSIILGRVIGVAGVVFSTALARIMTSFWFEGRVVFKRFDKPFVHYLFFQLKSLIVCIASVIISLLVCKLIKGNPYIVVGIKLLISIILGILFSLISYGHTVEFKTMISKIMGVFKRNKSSG